MPNSTTVPDDTELTEWFRRTYRGNSTEMPLEMVFNDGHRLSIAVYRHVSKLFERYNTFDIFNERN